MGLRPPGSRSTFTLLISGFWTLLALLILIGGHLALALLIYMKFFGQGGNMAHLAKFTGIPPGIIWLVIVAALALDIWIAVSSKHDREKKLRR